jgi:hypothetical protein
LNRFPEGATVIREAQLARVENGGYHLLSCATPPNRTLLPRLPEGVDLPAFGISIDGVTCPAPDGLLYLVLRLPGSSGRAR